MVCENPACMAYLNARDEEHGTVELVLWRRKMKGKCGATGFIQRQGSDTSNSRLDYALTDLAWMLPLRAGRDCEPTTDEIFYVICRLRCLRCLLTRLRCEQHVVGHSNTRRGLAETGYRSAETAQTTERCLRWTTTRGESHFRDAFAAGHDAAPEHVGNYCPTRGTCPAGV